MDYFSLVYSYIGDLLPSNVVDGIRMPKDCSAGNIWHPAHKSVGEWLEVNLGWHVELLEVEVVFQEDCRGEAGYMAGVEVTYYFLALSQNIKKHLNSFCFVHIGQSWQFFLQPCISSIWKLNLCNYRGTSVQWELDYDTAMPGPSPIHHL